MWARMAVSQLKIKQPSQLGDYAEVKHSLGHCHEYQTEAPLRWEPAWEIGTG
jgi:hypothetical protein